MSVPSLASSSLLLASASPRRKELLALLGVPFTVVVSEFDEASLSHLTNAEEYVLAAATGKAEDVAKRHNGIILGVDTDVVAPDGTILGKPVDTEHAFHLLRQLSGKTHRVYSAVVLLAVDEGKILRRESCIVPTDVTFAELSDEAIAFYVASGEPLDKAGAYGIQGGAMPFVTRVEGDLSSVIGLPLAPLTALLREFGIPLWAKENPI